MCETFPFARITKYCILLYIKHSKGDSMKKIWFALSVIVVIRLGTLVFLEMQLLDEPIILAQDVRLKNDALYVSYITNNAKPHEISYVEIGDTYLYPTQDTDLFGINTNSSQLNEYVRGRIYSIHAVTFPLNLEQRDIYFPNAATAIIHFTNGMKWEKPLTVSRPWVDQQILRESLLTTSNNGTEKETYTTEQDVVLTKLDFSELEDVTLAINHEQVELPLKSAITIPKDTLIEITFKAQIDLYPFDQYEIIFYMLDENKVPIEISMGNYKNNPPSSTWIHEFVKERGGK